MPLFGRFCLVRNPLPCRRFGDELRVVHLDGLAILPQRTRELFQKFWVAVFRVRGHGASNRDVFAVRKHADPGQRQGEVGTVVEAFVGRSGSGQHLHGPQLRRGQAHIPRMTPAPGETRNVVAWIGKIRPGKIGADSCIGKVRLVGRFDLEPQGEILRPRSTDRAPDTFSPRPDRAERDRRGWYGPGRSGPMSWYWDSKPLFDR